MVSEERGVFFSNEIKFRNVLSSLIQMETPLPTRSVRRLLASRWSIRDLSRTLLQPTAEALAQKRFKALVSVLSSDS